jgi:DNA topoisomerase-1
MTAAQAAVRQLQRSFADPKQAAAAAGLRHTSDAGPGISRVRRGKSFAYTKSGKPVRDDATLGRIKSLVIPPAWENVWICPTATGHIQAVGYDARGRKQYRYHPQWRAHRDLAKYTHVIGFAEALPAIRAAVRRDLKKPGLPREKVLAATVRVLEKTLIRNGNEQYTRENHTYGLSTLQDRHATIEGEKVTFDFRGKHGVKRHVSFRDPKLAEIVKACRDLPGSELFQYVGDDDRVVDIKCGDVNAYLKQVTGRDFTAKDFRTWAGTLLAARALQAMEAAETDTQVKKNIVSAIEATAARLGNTVAVCRKCYVHPAVLSSYMDGSLVKTLRRKINAKLAGGNGLTGEERSVLKLLRSTLATMATQQGA